jgi:hypothetical protein
MPELPRGSSRARRAAPLARRAFAGLVGALVVGAVVLAGCSSTTWDTSEADSQAASTVKQYSRDEAGVRESLVDHLSTVGSNLNEWAAPRDQAECAADKAIASFGVDRLLELGYEPSNGRLALPYTPDESAAMLNILTGCIDFEAAFLSMLSAYQKLDIDSSRCLARSLERLGVTRDLAAGLLTGTEPDPFAEDNRVAFNTTRAMIECLDNADLVPVIQQREFPQDVGETTTTTTPRSTTTRSAFGTGSGSGTTTTSEP